MALRVLAFVLALIAVYLLGRVVIDLVQLGILAWIELILGASAAAGAGGVLHASRRRPPR